MRPTFGQSLHPQMATCRIDLVDGALAITSPYDVHFVAALKTAIPGTDRKWDGARKQWLVSVAYGSQLHRLIEIHYGVTVSLPDTTGRAPVSAMTLLDVRYIGAAKTREDGSESAFGWSRGEWSVIFPKAVLLEFFGQTARPDEAQTLYGVLGVSQGVDSAALKIAWKRLARTWHPDTSKEPGSKEQFQTIQEAWQILSDTTMRAKYDAGLAFEALSRAHSRGNEDRLIEGRHYQALHDREWRAPLRCGLILVEGQNKLGRFVVSKLLQWADIVDSQGRVLVTSWAAGEDKFKESWVMP